jgi:hypothetical protein
MKPSSTTSSPHVALDEAFIDDIVTPRRALGILTCIRGVRLVTAIIVAMAQHASGVAMTTDLSSDEAIPYFLWDAPMTMRELRERLDASDDDRIYLLGKIMREARETDVWLFTTPEEVTLRWPDLERHLGRRRDFWNFLLRQWREQGLVS